MTREAKILFAADAFAQAWRECTEIRREITDCSCTEKSRPCESEGDPGQAACYTDRDADPSLMCEPCEKRLKAMDRLKTAKKNVVSLRGKLLRICAPSPVDG